MTTEHTTAVDTFAATSAYHSLIYPCIRLHITSL